MCVSISFSLSFLPTLCCTLSVSLSVFSFFPLSVLSPRLPPSPRLLLRACIRPIAFPKTARLHFCPCGSVNKGMKMEDFKFIFWMEYAHRMWGRALGIVFLAPCAYFAARGYITRSLAVRLGLLGSLGAGQGFVGWWMVQSGLEVRGWKLLCCVSVDRGPYTGMRNCSKHRVWKMVKAYRRMVLCGWPIHVVFLLVSMHTFSSMSEQLRNRQFVHDWDAVLAIPAEGEVARSVKSGSE